MSSVWVDVPGGKLNVRISGEGSPILLVHGWALDHRIFRPQLRYLERSFRVISFDRRGFGCSTAPPDLRLEVDDIDRILAAMSIDTMHLLGMSQGARIALRFAVMRPDRLRSLVLQGPAVDGLVLEEPDAERIPLEEYAALGRGGQIEEVRRRWLAHPMMLLGSQHPGARELIEEIVGTYTGADIIDYHPEKNVFTRNVLDELPAFPAPALIMTGTHETATRKVHARKLLEAIPNCREVVFRASGHLSNLSEVDLYNREVANFCASVDVRLSRLRSGALD